MGEKAFVWAEETFTCMGCGFNCIVCVGFFVCFFVFNLIQCCSQLDVVVFTFHATVIITCWAYV